MTKRDFWVRCPVCKRKFAVSVAIVLKYLDRLAEALEEEVNKIGQKQEMYVQSQRKAAPPEELPTE
jgi:hypothetical protein